MVNWAFSYSISFSVSLKLLTLILELTNYIFPPLIVYSCLCFPNFLRSCYPISNHSNSYLFPFFVFLKDFGLVSSSFSYILPNDQIESADIPGGGVYSVICTPHVITGFFQYFLYTCSGLAPALS